GAEQWSESPFAGRLSWFGLTRTLPASGSACRSSESSELCDNGFPYRSLWLLRRLLLLPPAPWTGHQDPGSAARPRRGRLRPVGCDHPRAHPAALIRARVGSRRRRRRGPSSRGGPCQGDRPRGDGGSRVRRAVAGCRRRRGAARRRRASRSRPRRRRAAEHQVK
ncbi:hypothetical protein BDA96_10G091200, partial [Sorghum bicolor]